MPYCAYVHDSTEEGKYAFFHAFVQEPVCFPLGLLVLWIQYSGPDQRLVYLRFAFESPLAYDDSMIVIRRMKAKTHFGRLKS